MFNNFIVKTLLKKQLKGLPPELQEKVMGLIEKNPELFIEIGTEIKKKVDSGMSQENAMKEIMAERGDEMKKLLG
jgi:hypothetical protein